MELRKHRRYIQGRRCTNALEITSKGRRGIGEPNHK
jgi:hypothetical protein